MANSFFWAWIAIFVFAGCGPVCPGREVAAPRNSAASSEPAVAQGPSEASTPSDNMATRNAIRDEANVNKPAQDARMESFAVNVLTTSGGYAPGIVHNAKGVLQVWKGVQLGFFQIPYNGVSPRRTIVDARTTALSVEEVEPPVRYLSVGGGEGGRRLL